MIEQGKIGLLGYLASKMDCTYMSDLQFLEFADRQVLIKELKNVSEDEVSLSEWNDALTYLTGQSPVESSEEAKERIIDYLL